MAGGVRIVSHIGQAMKSMAATSDAKLKEFAYEMAEIAKDEAPHITGHLRRSIQATHVETGWYRVETRTAGRVNQETGKMVKYGYGAIVELGTTRRAPNPFMARAFARARSNLRVG